DACGILHPQTLVSHEHVRFIVGGDSRTRGDGRRSRDSNVLSDTRSERNQSVCEIQFSVSAGAGAPKKIEHRMQPKLMTQVCFRFAFNATVLISMTIGSVYPSYSQSFTTSAVPPGPSPVSCRSHTTIKRASTSNRSACATANF